MGTILEQYSDNQWLSTSQGYIMIGYQVTFYGTLGHLICSNKLRFMSSSCSKNCYHHREILCSGTHSMLTVPQKAV